jgi:hypothetical protein
VSSVDYTLVAKGLVIATLAHIDYFQACPFCKAGEDDGDGADREHEEECPLVGFDQTRDCEALRAWATPCASQEPTVSFDEVLAENGMTRDDLRPTDASQAGDIRPPVLVSNITGTTLGAGTFEIHVGDLPAIIARDREEAVRLYSGHVAICSSTGERVSLLRWPRDVHFQPFGISEWFNADREQSR